MSPSMISISIDIKEARIIELQEKLKKIPVTDYVEERILEQTINKLINEITELKRMQELGEPI